jgi:hypothetical protein
MLFSVSLVIKNETANLIFSGPFGVDYVGIVLIPQEV